MIVLLLFFIPGPPYQGPHPLAPLPGPSGGAPVQKPPAGALGSAATKRAPGLQLGFHRLPGLGSGSALGLLGFRLAFGLIWLDFGLMLL